MKKTLLIISLISVCAILTGFVFNRHNVNYSDMEDGQWIYHTSVTAWYEATESETLYIYYKQGHGVRKYRITFEEDVNPTYYGYSILSNKLYKSRSCNDFRRLYQYHTNTGTPYYFNVSLPYMEKKTY